MGSAYPKARQSLDCGDGPEWHRSSRAAISHAAFRPTMLFSTRRSPAMRGQPFLSSSLGDPPDSQPVGGDGEDKDDGDGEEDAFGRHTALPHVAQNAASSAQVASVARM